MTSEFWDTRYAASPLVWSSTPNIWVEQIAKDMPAGRVLDLAGGDGRNSLWLAARGWDATVVDFSHVALDRAQQFASERGVDVSHLHTVQADLFEYVPSRRHFDLVLVVYLHLAPAERGLIMRKAADAVAPGGSLLIVGHDLANLANGIGGPQDPAVLYTAADLARDIASAGFDVLRAERITREVATDEGVRQALDALLLARRPIDATV